MIPRLFIEQPLSTGSTIAADERAQHYLRNVMRRSAGDPLVLFNGRDGEFEAEIAAIDKRKAEMKVTRLRRAQDGVLDIILCFAPLKKDAIDFLIEKGTELGAAAFQPVITRRTVASRLNLDRLRANAIEAAEQSERLTVPEIRAPLTLEALLSGWQPSRHMILCAEAGPALPIGEAFKALTARVSCPNTWAIFCGPEGGFHVSELDRLRDLPFVTPVGLGPRILRADTAALTALAVFQAILGDGTLRPPHPMTPFGTGAGGEE
ncbi:16S rRNA (uracil(1498)-N(3))-methyltransferase [Dongia deserti]|uniref:16S rRNA (uracil(1498)-N(3))-methyltransferase n=1 Tax=Dongia deserti TaxID=2268030 RepID=UPI000E651F38|nr:16S rRNA (uracil(1498)-N(3))-methyltransferase [Dongia deserti]